MLKIEIIEDDKATRRIIKLLLHKNFNCTLFEARNGKEGLEIMLKEKPDIVLLDLAMPVMDGLKVLQTKQRIPNLKKIPVLIVTALGQEALVEQCLGLGAKNYILKPFSSQEMVERIHKVIQKHIKRN